MREVMYTLHDELEATHWWFVARRKIVLGMLAPWLAPRRPSVRRDGRRAGGRPRGRPRILDIGCGAGGTLQALSPHGEVRGLDPSPEIVERARAKAGCEVRVGSLPRDVSYPPGSFDVVTLLDVLEHIEEDEASLAAVRDLLAPGGVLALTVPAFRFLWSGHDVVNEHRRRYTRAELRRKLEGAGLVVRKLSYYNAFLFPPIAAVRLLRGARDGVRDARPHLGVVPGPLNALLTRVFAAERHVLRVGAFPFGVSLLAVAERPGPERPEAERPSPDGGAA
jgi:SAM-dependent methyltransferase